MIVPLAVTLGLLPLPTWQGLVEPTPVRTVWDDVADCESGEWDRHGVPIEGTADWAYDDGLFEGGLNFHPDTWDWLRDPEHPDAAFDASREVQMLVAERVLEVQGWRAWPVCSRKLGLR